MLFFLIIGALIGAVSIIFILQNVTPVTVSFFAYQLQGSLAIILFLALIAGMLVSIFILLPSFVRDELRVRRLKKQLKALEDELAATKGALASTITEPTPAAPEPTQVVY